jgi:hypothetical protein
MKTALLAGCMAFITVCISAQSNSPETNGSNLYSLALKTSILQMEKDWGDIDDSVASGNMRTDYRHMIVQKDLQITNGLPAEFDNHFVEYLDSKGLAERYRNLRKSYAVLVIRPMQNEGKTLKIEVVVYWVSYKKRRLQLGASDWSDVEFRYDCDKRQFLVSSVKLGGI